MSCSPLALKRGGYDPMIDLAPLRAKHKWVTCAAGIFLPPARLGVSGRRRLLTTLGSFVVQASREQRGKPTTLSKGATTQAYDTVRREWLGSHSSWCRASLRRICLKGEAVGATQTHQSPYDVDSRREFSRDGRTSFQATKTGPNSPPPFEQFRATVFLSLKF